MAGWRVLDFLEPMDGDEELHTDSVRIIDFEKIDLSGATVIAGFPSIGLVSTIAANYLIDALNLKQVGALGYDPANVRLPSDSVGVSASFP